MKIAAADIERNIIYEIFINIWYIIFLPIAAAAIFILFVLSTTDTFLCLPFSENIKLSMPAPRLTPTADQ